MVLRMMLIDLVKNFAVVVSMETQHGGATVLYATGKCI